MITDAELNRLKERCKAEWPVTFGKSTVAELLDDLDASKAEIERYRQALKDIEPRCRLFADPMSCRNRKDWPEHSRCDGCLAAEALDSHGP